MMIEIKDAASKNLASARQHLAAVDVRDLQARIPHVERNTLIVGAAALAVGVAVGYTLAVLLTSDCCDCCATAAKGCTCSDYDANCCAACGI